MRGGDSAADADMAKPGPLCRSFADVRAKGRCREGRCREGGGSAGREGGVQGGVLLSPATYTGDTERHHIAHAHPPTPFSLLCVRAAVRRIHHAHVSVNPRCPRRSFFGRIVNDHIQLTPLCFLLPPPLCTTRCCTPPHKGDACSPRSRAASNGGHLASVCCTHSVQRRPCKASR